MSAGRPAGPVVCLLPVRNGEDDLPGWLESAAVFADAVVALDDGSTDGTRALLEASPLVRALLANPPRDGYRGWDDAANRGRLLEAAGRLEPSWIVSLDADERLDPDDGRALRSFLESDALPGFAFGFRVYRMWGSTDRCETTGYWVYRLFAYEHGQRFPEQRLHFDPIPTSIPPSHHLRTTLRIQHLAGLTSERRAARIAKYEEADPGRAFRYRYQDVADGPTATRPWEPRPPGLPVLLAPGTPADEPPALTAIVISRDDERTIARAVRSVVEQECPWPFEVVVVTSGSDRTAEIVQDGFPGVTLVALPEPALPGVARNAGLRVARGDYVSFPGSHIELPPGSLAARIAAHDLGYAMVTGTTLNGTTTAAGWAAYFLDHSSVLPGRPSTELGGPPAHCSYTRRALLDVGGFPEHLRAGEDTVVNQELFRRGHRAYRAQDVRLVHHNRCPTARRLVRHYFTRGRSFGRILLDRHRTRGRLLRERSPVALYRIQVRERLTTVSAQVQAWGDELERARHRRSRLLVRAGATAHWLGTCAELLRPRRGLVLLLLGRPTVTLLVVADAPGSEGPGVALVRVDVVSRRAKALLLPAGADPEPPVAVDAAVALDRVEAWPRRLLSPRVLLDRRLPLGVRLTLAWAARAVRPGRVHTIGVAGDADRAERLLDTRDRHERKAPAPAQPRRPLFAGRAPGERAAERAAER